MKHFRSLSLLSIFFLSSSLSQAADESSPNFSHAQSWGQLCHQHMDAQQLQITANILYLLYANALVDTKMQQFYTALSRLTQTVRSNMAHIANPNNELATLKTVTERLSLISGTRTIYTTMLKVSLDHYNQNATQLVNEALEALQLHGQDVLRSWANEQAQETATQLEACTKILSDGAQYLHVASGLHKGLSEGNLPVEVPAEEDNKSLAILGILLQSTPQIFNVTDTITNTLNDAGDHAMKIIGIGTALYKEHYRELYTIVSAPSFNKQYATTMFSMHGLLPEEFKTTLPAPENVFEHMLQTTKLYTQTEISQ